jgi:hypothetical protein
MIAAGVNPDTDEIDSQSRPGIRSGEPFARHQGSSRRR